LAQDGQQFNECIDAAPQVTIVPDSIVQSVYHMSDHLPVLMDLHFDCEEGQVISSDSTSICQGDTAWVGGNPYVSEGWAYDTISSELSCNRFHATYVEVTPVDTSVMRSGDSLWVQASNAGFQWIDCSNGSAIGGATDSLFVPTTDGNYAVEVTQNGCTDTSGCHQVLFEGIEEHDAERLELKVYPDPGKGSVRVRTEQVFNGRISIMDLEGREVRTEQVRGSSSYRLRTEDLAPGLYLIELRERRTGQRRVEKWMRER
jgi:hypothetical protein